MGGVSSSFDAQNIRAKVTNDGYAIQVSYDWPDIMQRADTVLQLFSKESIHAFDPLMTGMRAAINNIRGKDKTQAIIRGSFIINLPFKVYLHSNRERFDLRAREVQSPRCMVLKITCSKMKAKEDEEDIKVEVYKDPAEMKIS